MEAMNDTTTRKNDTVVEDELTMVSRLFSGLGIIFCAWIIGANLFLCACFLKQWQDLMKNSFAFNVLILSITDTIAGFSPLPGFIGGLANLRTFSMCVFRTDIFLSAQLAVLLHIFGICLDRLRSVCNLRKTRATRSYKPALVYSITSWICVFVTMTFPFIVWSDWDDEITVCLLPVIFKNKYLYSIRYVFVIFAVPFLVTNGTYLIIIIRLLLHVPKNKIAPSSSSALDKKQCPTGNTNSITERCTERGESCTDRGERCTERGVQTAVKDLKPTNKTSDCHDQRDADTISGTIGKGNKDNTTRRSGNTLMLRRQRKAIKTIGFVLCAFDICVLPFLLVCGVDSFTSGTLPKEFRQISGMILPINSVVNPIMYSWALERGLRKTIKQMFCKTEASL